MPTCAGRTISFFCRVLVTQNCGRDLLVQLRSGGWFRVKNKAGGTDQSGIIAELRPSRPPHKSSVHNWHDEVTSF